MNPDDYMLALAMTAVLTRELLWVAAIGIAVSGMDDLAVDLLWLFGVAARPPQPLPPRPAEPGAFAILIPAWDESAVIGPMLSRLLRTLRHPRFHIFVGVYPNDPATRAAVETLGDARISVVPADRPGPTTKADCLNNLWRAALAHEQAEEMRFKAIVLHDAEDVVHPLSLDVYDRWMPRLAMVQLPVIPFVDADSRWISGHYLDEFAENHGKDMEVRALLGAPVPSAGVGTAIDREVLARIAGNGAPFDASSLTEDYELGHRIHAMGLSCRLVRHSAGSEPIATREFFPATLEAAVQQKSRWQTGIALAGWDRIGWPGGFAARWMLLRDRKGPAASAISMIAYAALALSVAQIALRQTLAGDGLAVPPFLGARGGAMQALLWLNAALLGWRLLMRAHFTARLHGFLEGFRAIPRAIVANIVNFLATLRALARYRDGLEGAGQSWGKTAHRFPGAAEMPHG